MKTSGFTHDNKDNISVDWYTPSWVFEAMKIQFDLDPCTIETGIPWIPVNKWYSLKDDGLNQPWEGNVWLNPPYGRHTGNWLEKMHNHRNGVSLLFARTDCSWFHKYVTFADCILFLKSRISFIDGHGETKGSGAGAGSMLIAWGESNRAALTSMDKYGFLVYPEKKIIEPKTKQPRLF